MHWVNRAIPPLFESHAYLALVGTSPLSHDQARSPGGKEAVDGAADTDTALKSSSYSLSNDEMMSAVLALGGTDGRADGRACCALAVEELSASDGVAKSLSGGLVRCGSSEKSSGVSAEKEGVSENQRGPAAWYGVLMVAATDTGGAFASSPARKSSLRNRIRSSPKAADKPVLPAEPEDWLF